MVEGIVYDSILNEYRSTKAGRVILTSGVVVDIIEIGLDGWNTGVIVMDLIIQPSSDEYPQGQTCMFHNDEVQ